MRIFKWSIEDGLSTLALWVGGFCIVLLLVVYLFPSLSDLVDAYMDESGLILALMGKEAEYLENQNIFDMWLTMEVFSWMGVLLAAYVVIYAAGAIAGEVDSGTMEMLLAQPVRRRSVVLGRFFAAAVKLAILLAAGFFSILIAHSLWIDKPASFPEYADVFINNYLLLLCIAGFSFMVSAVAGEQKRVIGICMGVVLLSFMLNMVVSIARKWTFIARLTPFYYCDASKVLHRGGIDVVDAAVLFFSGIFFLMLAVRLFESRDIA